MPERVVPRVQIFLGTLRKGVATAFRRSGKAVVMRCHGTQEVSSTVVVGDVAGHHVEFA